MAEPIFPDAHVQLSGEDGNAFFIIRRTCSALKKAGASSMQIDDYMAQAQSGDYDNVLQTTMRWVGTS